MSDARRRGVRLRSIVNLVVVAAFLCLTVPISLRAFCYFEERQVAAKAEAYLRTTDPHLELWCDGTVPYSSSRTMWTVYFYVRNHPTIDGAKVEIDSQGECKGSFHYSNSK